MIALLRTYAVAGAGVAAFMVLDLPLPWLLGPISACLIAGLVGVEMQGLKPLNEAMRAILGVAVGATLTLSVVASMAAMWPTLLMIPVLILFSGLIGVPYFQRLWGLRLPNKLLLRDARRPSGHARLRGGGRR